MGLRIRINKENVFDNLFKNKEKDMKRCSVLAVALLLSVANGLKALGIRPGVKNRTGAPLRVVWQKKYEDAVHFENAITIPPGKQVSKYIVSRGAVMWWTNEPYPAGAQKRLEGVYTDAMAESPEGNWEKGWYRTPQLFHPHTLEVYSNGKYDLRTGVGGTGRGIHYADYYIKVPRKIVSQEGKFLKLKEILETVLKKHNDEQLRLDIKDVIEKKCPARCRAGGIVIRR